MQAKSASARVQDLVAEPEPEPPSRPPSTGADAPVTLRVTEASGLPSITSLAISKANPRTRLFRKRYFPEATSADWNDWRWQLRHRIRDTDELARIVNLSGNERAAIERHSGPLPVGITPYYLSLVDEDDPDQPLRRTVVPVLGEYLRTVGEADDPLHEDGDSPVPAIVHRYPDRALFLVTGSCSVYCRYCTRSRMVGNGEDPRFGREVWRRALDYIAGTPAIRDVLISGGDPLTLPDHTLEWLLAGLRAIPHVEMVRLGTKVPAVLPMRVTAQLVRMLRKYHPFWMSLHFTHPDELTPEVAAACGRLADAGIPLGSQTVLLAGVNDDVETMRRLMHGLLKMRVKPYYLYQCDPISGSSHFRTPVERGLEIIAGLRGHTTGYAVPAYVVDAPGGGGKIPLLAHSVVGRDGDDLLLRNHEGRLFRYPDPGGSLGAEQRETLGV